jgi:hypothetical protein
VLEYHNKTSTKMQQGNQKASTTYKKNTKRIHKKQYTTRYDENSFY